MTFCEAEALPSLDFAARDQNASIAERSLIDWQEGVLLEILERHVVFLIPYVHLLCISFARIEFF